VHEIEATGFTTDWRSVRGKEAVKLLGWITQDLHPNCVKTPFDVKVAEPAVAVAVGMKAPVFLPLQRQRHTAWGSGGA
jgi:hypothetical protein